MRSSLTCSESLALTTLYVNTFSLQEKKLGSIYNKLASFALDKKSKQVRGEEEIGPRTNSLKIFFSVSNIAFFFVNNKVWYECLPNQLLSVFYRG